MEIETQDQTELIEKRNISVQTDSLENRESKICDSDTICAICYLLSLFAFTLFSSLPGLPAFVYPLGGNLLDSGNVEGPSYIWYDGAVCIAAIYGAIIFRKMFIIFLKHIKFTKDIEEGKLYTYNENGSLVSMNSSKKSARNDTSDIDIIVEKPYPAHSKNIWIEKHNSFRIYLESLNHTHEQYLTYIWPGVLYHIICGVWIGWSVNAKLGYYTSDNFYLALGIALFLLGEMCIWIYWLREYYKKENLFISCIFIKTDLFREVFNVVSLVGFAIYTLTLPACLLALSRLIISICYNFGVIDSYVF